MNKRHVSIPAYSQNSRVPEFDSKTLAFLGTRDDSGVFTQMMSPERRTSFPIIGGW